MRNLLIYKELELQFAALLTLKSRRSKLEAQPEVDVGCGPGARRCRVLGSEATNFETRHCRSVAPGDVTLESGVSAPGRRIEIPVVGIIDPRPSAELQPRCRPEVELDPPAPGVNRHAVPHHVLPYPATAKSRERLAGKCLGPQIHRPGNRRPQACGQCFRRNPLPGGVHQPSIMAPKAHFTRLVARTPPASESSLEVRTVTSLGQVRLGQEGALRLARGRRQGGDLGAKTHPTERDHVGAYPELRDP